MPERGAALPYSRADPAGVMGRARFQTPDDGDGHQRVGHVRNDVGLCERPSACSKLTYRFRQVLMLPSPLSPIAGASCPRPGDAGPRECSAGLGCSGSGTVTGVNRTHGRRAAASARILATPT